MLESPLHILGCGAIGSVVAARLTTRDIPIVSVGGTQEQAAARATTGIIGAVVSFDAELTGPGRVLQHTDRRALTLGPWGRQPAAFHPLAELLAEAFDVRLVNNIEASVLAKLVRNALINAPCAIADLDVGGLTSDPDLLEVALDLAREACAVIRASGLDVDPDLNFGLKSTEFLTVPRPELHRRVRAALPADLRAIPSTLQDLRAGRPPETRDLAAWVIEESRRHDVPIPVTTMTLALLDEVAAKRCDRGTEARAALLQQHAGRFRSRSVASEPDDR